MVHTVEGFGEINGCNDRTKGRFLLVKARRDLGSKWQQRSGGRPSGGEAMLESSTSEVGEDEGPYEAFEEFRGGAKERNGTVRGA